MEGTRLSTRKRAERRPRSRTELQAAPWHSARPAAPPRWPPPPWASNPALLQAACRHLNAVLRLALRGLPRDSPAFPDHSCSTCRRSLDPWALRALPAPALHQLGRPTLAWHWPGAWDGSVRPRVWQPPGSATVSRRRRCVRPHTRADAPNATAHVPRRPPLREVLRARPTCTRPARSLRCTPVASAAAGQMLASLLPLAQVAHSVGATAAAAPAEAGERAGCSSRLARLPTRPGCVPPLCTLCPWYPPPSPAAFTPETYSVCLGLAAAGAGTTLLLTSRFLLRHVLAGAAGLGLRSL